MLMHTYSLRSDKNQFNFSRRHAYVTPENATQTKMEAANSRYLCGESLPFSHTSGTDLKGHVPVYK